MKKAPWHLWVVAITALLWNASGAYTIMMAQAGKLYDLEPGASIRSRASCASEIGEYFFSPVERPSPL